ncbi:TOX high mobility group box family member 3-like isoform X2 [Leptopilina heterotoma]|uniref:TOX high mobility group box family member 3-like isoform X2 n=1 Tax=Leptopilina heterotoma TaxID=63436 RepID=UPI001CA8EA53|nr:TOX high mobility group box family member 3-like isoform X2 [Leptopilina heterotoma]
MSDGIVGAITISLFGGEKKRRGSMDAGYSMLSGDLDVSRMFDQYSYKRSDNIDLSLSVPQHHQTSYHHDGYNMTDQTFHTPSFGDEDFDIPSIHTHSHQQHQQQQQHHQQHDPMHAYQSQMMPSGGMQQSPDGLSLDPGGYQQPLYLQQEHSMQPISVSSAYNSPQGTYSTMSSPGQQHSNQQLLLLQQQHNQQQQQQQQAQMQQQQMQYMHSQQQQQQQQQAQMQQQQMHFTSHRGSTGPSPAAMPNALPENNNTTTSEDSDDSTPHSAMMAGIKRPSPEPADGATKAQKKPKAQKKRKKKDPNEPPKPVSAYALFFRDTQAAIKGQNPNASFGEVSKIVASMWDALDTEHKDVYKKKTEAAKKEYLKALAAYRASLVSKGATENEQQTQQQQQQQQPQPQAVPYGVVPYSAYGGNTQPGNVAYQVYSPQPQPPSPQQHQQQQHQQQMGIKKSPLHLAQMQGNQQQQQQALMGNPMAPPHMTQQHMQQQVSQQQYMQQVPQQQVQPVQVQQQQMMHMSPARNELKQDLSSPPPVNSSQAAMVAQRAPANTCIRHGCPNPAVANTEWEDEYCSNECVVSHCRDVFTTWVSTNQQQNFSTVK